MPTVSVQGMSGKMFLQDFEIGPGETISRLQEAVKESLGLTQPGLELKLILDTEILREDAVAEDSGLVDGCVLTAQISDILSSVRELTEIPSYAGSNVSEAASKGAWMDVIRLIEEGADLTATYDTRYSALMHIAACPHEHNHTAQLDPQAAAQLMRWMLLRGADAKQVDANNKTALHIWGKYGGCLQQGEVLIEFGADVNHEMNGGYTPLWYVRNYKRPQPPLQRGHVSGTGNAERRRALDFAEAGDLWQQAEAMLTARGAVEKP